MSLISNEAALYNEVANPLDGIEEIMTHNDWSFSRPYDDQLSVQVNGKSTVYDLNFLWQPEYNAMQFSCQMDLSIPMPFMEQICGALQKINQKLWMGYFTAYEEDGFLAIKFRHTCLYRGLYESSGIEIAEDLIDVALAECERYYATFQMISSSVKPYNDNLDLSLMDVAGCS